MTVKDRINLFIEIKGLKINTFESSIGVSKSYWNNTQKISAEVAAEVLRVYPELSAEWLLRGEGEMLRTTVTQNNQNGDNIQGHSVNVNKAPEDRLLDIVHTQAAQLTPIAVQDFHPIWPRTNECFHH